MAVRLLHPKSLFSILPQLAIPPRLALGLPLLWRIRNSSFLQASIALPSISFGVPALLADLWESILRAVPKKKTSYSKKRHRQLAGKALKDVTNLNKCSSCGRVKRAHLLCPYCVQFVRDLLGGRIKGDDAEQKRKDTKADA